MPDPSVLSIPGGYRFVYPLEQVRITVSRIVDDRRTLATSAELTVASTNTELPGHLHQARVNLTSSQGKNGFAKALNARDDTIDWASVVEAVCLKTLEMHRQGEPVVEVGRAPLRATATHRLAPILVEGQPTVIFGEGGSFKSYIATMMGILVKSGSTLLGLCPLKGNVLYLDWETSSEELNERVRALCVGLGLDAIGLDYRYCCAPIADDLSAIQEIVADREVGLVIVDSLGAACGGDPNSAEVAVRMFAAIRSLHVSTLLIDHVSKNSEKPTPFGSVYKVNYGRSVWEIKRVQNLRERAIRVALYHRKVNNGPLLAPVGFAIEFHNSERGQVQEVHIGRLSVDQDTDLSTGLPQRERIIGFLRAGKASPQEIADGTGIPVQNIRVRLNQYKTEGAVVKVGDDWALPAREEQEVPF